ARAALNQAQVNLDYTSIHSPVDGVVISRSVDVGQTVAASLQTPTLFLIANDLTQMQVNANVDEADIGNISNVSEVSFTVDAYPNRVFRGRITEIRLNPQTIQNVVTYNVIINVGNEQLELKPGMTANLTITVAEQADVIKIPNAALRYLPPGVTREQVAEMLRQPQAEVASGATSSQPVTDGIPTSPQTRPENSKEPSEAALSEGQGLNPQLSSEGRRAFAQRMQELPESERQRIRERAGNFGPGEKDSPATPVGQQTSRSSRETNRQSQLAPGQMWDPAEKIRFTVSGPRGARPGIVWVLGRNNKPEPRRVLLGITDGSSTQVVSGELQETDKVIVGDTSEAAPSSPGGAPFMGGPFGIRRR
ncbi:MAG: efflux RND transporter periplasmic adaptor subunit, partial [Acidobacteria bacterium]|nr:efflux RND transporter periplasmic adaptor subunit [Acidobacteriota bacterium]